MKKCLISFFVVFFSIIGLWILSKWIGNPFILPDPFLVGKAMIEQIQEPAFYQNLGMTLLRVTWMILISFCFGILLALSTLYSKSWKRMVDPFLTIVRSIPNITLLIVLLFWLNRERSIFWLLFLVLFPIVYQNFMEEFETITAKWSMIFDLYSQPKLYLVKKVYLPMCRSTCFSSLISITTLGFKVVVMAEVLAQVQFGIGHEMQMAKLNVDLADLIAWTIWLLLFASLYVWILKKGIRFLFAKGELWN